MRDKGILILEGVPVVVYKIGRQFGAKLASIRSKMKRDSRQHVSHVQSAVDQAFRTTFG